MGVSTINSCFDHEAMKSSSKIVANCCNQGNLLSFSSNISTITNNLTILDNTHDVLGDDISAISGFAKRLTDCNDILTNLATSLEVSVAAYGTAEFLEVYAKTVSDDLGYEDEAKKITDGTVNTNTIADNRQEFLINADQSIKDFITQYARCNDSTYPSDKYASEAEWTAFLYERYANKGYSSYDIEQLVLDQKTQWRLRQTGATITTSVSAAFSYKFAEYINHGKTVSTEYNSLVENYKGLGYTEEQANKLASAESELVDAVEQYKDERVTSAQERYDNLIKEYGDLRSTETGGTPTGGNPNGGGGGNPRGGGNPNGGGNETTVSDTPSAQSDNPVQLRVEETTPSQTNNTNTTTDTKPNSTTDTNTNTVTKPDSSTNTNTDTKPNNNTNTKPDTNTNTNTDTKPNTNTNTNTETNTNTNTNNNTNNQQTQNSTPSTNTYNRPSSNTSGVVQGGSNSQTSGAGEIVDNSGAQLGDTQTVTSVTDSDIITSSGSNKNTSSAVTSSSSTPTTTTKTSGNSVIPVGIGIAAAGAAAVAGTKYIKKKSEENYYSDEESDTKDNNDFSYLGDYKADGDNSAVDIQTNSANTINDLEENKDVIKVSDNDINSNKYTAGSINKLVLENSDDIVIEENNNHLENSKEELE